MNHTTPQRLALTVGAVQMFLALCWTVYVVFLPRLCAQAGLEAGFEAGLVPWILLADQAIFAVCDWAAGIWADRAGRVVGRIGKLVVAATAISCAAFFALPFAAPDADPRVFLALILAWSATSSALRAPLIVLIGRHAPRSSQPFLAALLLLGTGVAGAASPYLAATLAKVDARFPFALASLALLAMTWVLSTAEAMLPRPQAVPPPEPSARTHGSTLTWFLIAVAFLGIGFQVHVAVNAAPSYLKFAAQDQLERLMPLFWIGFSVATVPAAALTRRWGGPLTVAFGAVIGGLATFVIAAATSLDTVIAGELVAGAAWGCVLMSALSAALAFGHTGAEGKFAGGLFSVLALAAVARIALGAGFVVPPTALAAFLPWTPTSAWLLAAMVLLCMLAYGKARGA